MSGRMPYEEIVERRRALRVPEGYEPEWAILASAGLEGPWVTPPQMTSDNRDGPVLVGTHFLDLSSAWTHCPRIRHCGGYLPEASFNRVLDLALWLTRLHRRDIYVTQACHLLPLVERRGSPPEAVLGPSFDCVTRHELQERVVIPLGGTAARKCRAWHGRERNFELRPRVTHPGAGGSFVGKASELAEALASVTDRRQVLLEQRRILRRICDEEGEGGGANSRPVHPAPRDLKTRA